MLGKSIRRVVRLFGYDPIRIGRRSVLFLQQSRRLDAWFSYPVRVGELLKQLKIDLVLDVGANEGQFVAALRRVYNGPVISFEPVSATFRKLQERVSRDPQWRACQYALGNARGSAQINVTQNSVFSSLLTPNQFASDRFSSADLQSTSETIQIQRMDEVLPELVPDIRSRRVFLKMDTQGYDLTAFEGLGALASSVYMLQSEVSCLPIYDGMPHWTEAVRVYESQGFRVAGLHPVNWDGLAVIEYDCLMVRK